MATTAADSAVKFHVSLNVADLAQSIAFYRTLFGLNIHDWQTLKDSAVAGQFLLLTPDENAV